MVREPIDRNVSAFFEVLEFYTALEKKPKIESEELFEIFMKKLPHEYPINWFDMEIKKYIGIDIYDYPFDAENKFQIIEKENVRLLLVRTDATDEKKIASILKFSRTKISAIPRLNAAKHKYYKEDYDQFIKTNSFSKSYIYKLLDTKYVQHFFSKQEIDLLIKKWS